MLPKKTGGYGIRPYDYKTKSPAVAELFKESLHKVLHQDYTNAQRLFSSTNWRVTIQPIFKFGFVGELKKQM